MIAREEISFKVCMKLLEECSWIWSRWGQLLMKGNWNNNQSHTSRRTCKRNFSGSCQPSYWTDGGSRFHPHLIGPARGTSHRIMPAQLLNRRRISSSSTYISSDLQDELLTRSQQPSYWTDGGSRLHPHLIGPARRTSHRITTAQLLNRRRILFSSTSRRTYKRNFSQDHASAVTEQTEDLVFIHIQGMDSRKTFTVFMNHDFE